MAKEKKRTAVELCVLCGGRMRSSVETRRYSKLVNVVLVGVNVHRCDDCGEEELAIPKIEELHCVIARAVAQRRGRLTPGEVRWLRTHLGYSSVDFAKVMGVKPETVSRWERLDAPARMSVSAERLLRLMVLQDRPLQDYGLQDMGADKPPNELIRVRPDGNHWQTEAANT